MPSSDRINAAVINRIRTSGRTLTVHYPGVRPTATGTSPGTAPLSPLTGPAPTLKAIPTTTETPSQASVTVDCLFLTAYAGVPQSMRAFGIEQTGAGWFAGAQACARVVMTDVLLSASAPYGDTIFTAASHVEYADQRYKILATVPFGSSFSSPATAYVWLGGATKQTV
jgi:hypothetical protein